MGPAVRGRDRAGATQVMSDRYLDPERVLNLLEQEGVTLTAGYPRSLDRRSEPDGGGPAASGSVPLTAAIVSGGSAVPQRQAHLGAYRRLGIELE